MTEKKEMSQLQRQLLSGGGGVTLFTQQEFDEALDLAKGEIMMLAMETAKQAVVMEREACAKIVDEWANSLASEPEMVKIAEQIRNRIPSQRQQ